ncbi:ATP-dependent Clp endopeptidase proteolytic subunit ClpP [Komarekiella sp. 'clone 1']|uniref:ATP-dependent Clp protease proteolytic subunit n=1 Tax=Komarekiella delphini-convector SJRDD-AB1 TaxID=2593771 RepID=A0AA40SY11_9NOST|nr:ATP-dependent Clp endopeptidase proteolytic subunit ClpP [Komarekiella delphini-convector]MBD6617180.1 ATP-dependent Clp endopeptidase proteolytic subunit ClpP [Komarekiella delphini-convector SJRDD-AB1]
MNPTQPSIPFIIQESAKGERVLDIYSRLLAERIIFLRNEVTDEIANLIVAQMLFLDAEEPERDITLYINSPGGSVTAGMAIYDAMNQVRSEVCTVCMGTAASMGAFLLASGTQGKRYALPNARIMIHQPSGGVQGKASDIEVAAKEILYFRQLINKILAANTGKSPEQIELDSERDFFMSAQEAKAYGLIDSIIIKTSASIQSTTSSDIDK